MTQVYVGIDSHSEFHKVAILPEVMMGGAGEDDWETKLRKKIKPIRVANNRESYEGLHAVLVEIAEPPEIAVALEFTGGVYTVALCRFLSEKGYQMRFIEAKALKHFKSGYVDQAEKSDDIDCREIAFYLYARVVLKRNLRVSLTSPELGTQAALLKQLVAQRWTMQKSCTQMSNRLHGMLKMTFPEGEENYFDQLVAILPEYPTPRAIIEESDGMRKVKYMREGKRSGILKAAKETVGVPGEIHEEAIRMVATERRQAVEKIEQIEQRIERIVWSNPYGKVLCSFPQVSSVTAATLIAVIRDIDRYPTDRHLQKMLGVSPGQRQTGNGVGRSKMLFEGSKDARRVIYQIIFGCLHPNAPPNDVRDSVERSKAKGEPTTSAMMRASVVLCEQVYHCLKNGVFWEYQGSKNGTPGV